ncbi:E3 binding domain-containing protein [Hymenobacter sp. HSC-4F20]|uniref:E3 binding domain-containing protein n=1 Tax=Hymenobacter sp. HSC-4F20 TaxID=2864135 RepID=UPI001C7316FB|nr:E3 binding domain-containing protein [Hymenobacter sp. HSC-4F20]MBX0289718.1 E3 binding domain-containing protein [Hymenobacter sp. HSC-4F20]
MPNDVYEPSDSNTEHNPYDTKVGGKPACTLADGTTPQVVKQKASTADGPAAGATEAADDESDDPVNASAAAKKLAEENGIDLNTVTGTGSNGGITKADVEKAIAEGQQ